MSTEENIVSEPAPAPAPISVVDIAFAAPAPPPAPITLDDLLTSVEVVTKKEADDKAVLEGISGISHENLKAKLLVWATAGFPNVYEIHRLSITPPNICSDGVARELSEYITFCSGKSIHEHVALLQAKVTGMAISFANMGNYISIVVSKL